ncbi:MAG: trypsin-like peptidase domain-containing protein [Planctomycetes bacterium]|nr:trypsin-like peptidase domain-containing protein [Planctomycetota bacterium]
MKPLQVVTPVLLLALCTSVRSQDAALRAKAKDLLDKHKESIVTVKVVTTTRYIYLGRETHKQENKLEVSGTVIDPSGLTVLSNYTTDPFSGEEFSFENGGDKVDFKPETSVSDLKIVLADGTEIPADFVLKDKDLDLAFVKPKEKPAQPLPSLAFAKPAAEPELLEEIISIGRLGREVNRASCVKTGNIEALVKKPRTFYVTDSNFLGCPVFNAKGETLGLAVMRRSPIKGQNMFGGASQVVLPSEDLLEVAKQAAEAKPLAAKANPPKSEEVKSDVNKAESKAGPGAEPPPVGEKGQ